MTAGAAPDRRAVWWGGAALLVVCAAIAPRLNWVGPNEDSGVIGGWAMQIAAGQVPYRDFFMFPTPGSALLYAGAFKLFGATFVVERALTGLAILAACGALFEIGRRLLPGFWAAALVAVWGSWMAVFFQYGPHHFWGITCLIWMALALTRRRFLLAGLAAGLAVVFLQSAAVAVAFGLLCTVLLERDWRRSLLPMIGGGLAVAMALAVGLLAAGAWNGFLADAVFYTVRYYPAGNRISFPWTPSQLIDSAPIDASGAALWLVLVAWPLVIALPLACAAYAVVAAVRWRGRGEPSPRMVLALLSTGFFLAVLGVRLTAPLGWFAAALAMVLLASRIRDLTAGRRLLLAPAAVLLLAGLIPVPLGPVIDCRLNPHSAWRPIRAEGGTICAFRQSADSMEAARDFVVAHPGTKVAFLPLAGSFYLLAGETPPTSVIYYVPGVMAPGQVDELERSLVQGRVEYVLYFKADLTQNLPQDRALFEPGPTEFDRLLERDYERDPAADTGGMAAWRLKAGLR